MQQRIRMDYANGNANGNGYFGFEEEDSQAGVAALVASVSCIFPYVLNAAIELDLFLIIHQAGNGAQLSPSDILSRLHPIHGRQAKPDAVAALDSILQLLTANLLLNCSIAQPASGGATERRYGIAPAGKFFIGDGSGPSLVDFQKVGHYDADRLKVLQNLKDGVVGDGSGSLFEQVTGKSVYEYAESNPGYYKVLHGAMRSHSVLTLEKVLQKYRGFEGLGSIVNVAGGDGATLEMIISKYPSIRGINFDLPEVVHNAPAYQGIEHIGGDMFVEVPPGEAILIKYTLHNWKDEQCLQVLRNCYKALPDDKTGKVIVLECMVPQVPTSDVHSMHACQMNVCMSALFGAKERTKEEFEFLAKAAGFSEFKAICYAESIWVMEFIKSK